MPTVGNAPGAAAAGVSGAGATSAADATGAAGSGAVDGTGATGAGVPGAGAGAGAVGAVALGVGAPGAVAGPGSPWLQAATTEFGMFTVVTTPPSSPCLRRTLMARVAAIRLTT